MRIDGHKARFDKVKSDMNENKTSSKIYEYHRCIDITFCVHCHTSHKYALLIYLCRRVNLCVNVPHGYMDYRL